MSNNNVEVKVKVSKTVKEKGQKQITISGLPARSDKAPLSIRKGVTNNIKFKYNNNGEVHGELVVGDTHGIHRGHQTEEGKTHFDFLYSKLSEPQTIKVGEENKVVDPLGREVPLKIEVVENVGGSVVDASELSGILS